MAEIDPFQVASLERQGRVLEITEQFRFQDRGRTTIYASESPGL